MLNKIIIIGRLGKDPEVKTTQGDNKIASFSIATSETYKNKDGEKVEDTEWFNVVMWGRSAEICEKYLKKGSLVYIEGKMKTRSYENSNGETRYTTELVGREMKMLGWKGGSDGKQDNDEGGSGDLPF